ncbi:MAG: metallophosphoesterase [Cyclobacteriaceae bacterium]|nr:metallophosphoesterase [Cyclobacteriaceae bacterium]
MTRFLTLIVAMCLVTACAQQKTNTEDNFSFLFITDLHLQHERNAYQAFQLATDTINQLKADFVLTGGDLVFDVMRGNLNRSDSLFNLYKTAAAAINKKVYPCVGNHDLFGIYPESDTGPDHPDYKYGMFERHFGATYYSFDHKGWHFIVLNSLDVKDQKYIGYIDDAQKEWLAKDLEASGPGTPVVVVSHLPFISTIRQKYPSSGAVQDSWIINRNEIIEIFDQYNVRLVLQGHVHFLEDLHLENKTRYITGGAIAGRPSWRGDSTRIKEGFLHFHVNGEEVTWDYIEYGWHKHPDKVPYVTINF